MSVVMAPIAVNTCVTTHMAHITACALMGINLQTTASCVMVSSINYMATKIYNRLESGWL